MSYNWAKELVKNGFGRKVWTPQSLDFIAYVQEELLQQQLLVFQTGSFRDM